MTEKLLRQHVLRFSVRSNQDILLSSHCIHLLRHIPRPNTDASGHEKNKIAMAVRCQTGKWESINQWATCWVDMCWKHQRKLKSRNEILKTSSSRGKGVVTAVKCQTLKWECDTSPRWKHWNNVVKVSKWLNSNGTPSTLSFLSVTLSVLHSSTHAQTQVDPVRNSPFIL